MAKTLATQAESARQRRWSEILYLLELTLNRDKFSASPTSTTLRLSDRTRQEIGQEWSPLIVNWGEVGDALGTTETDLAIGRLDVVVSNRMPILGRARFSDLIRHALNTGTETWDLAFAEAKLYLLFKGGSAGDEVTLFRLAVEEAAEVTQDTVTLRMTGIESALEDRDDLYRLTRSAFPSIDPDSENKVVPIPLGTLKKIPGFAVEAGIVDKLRSDMTATSPANGGSLNLSDAALVSRYPATGTVQIDDEQITYTGRSGTTLTGITRAANATTAVAHTAGAAVFEVRSTYTFVFGENRGNHAAKAVNAVYADGTLQPAANYTVNLANTTLVSGRSFVTVAFTVKPIIKRQVVMTATDTIGVNDAITVSDNISASTVSQENLDEVPTDTMPIDLDTAGVASKTLTFSALPSGGTVQKSVWTVSFRVITWGVASGGHIVFKVVGLTNPASVDLFVKDGGGGAEKDLSPTATFTDTDYTTAPNVQVTKLQPTDNLHVQMTIAHQNVMRTIPITKAGAASRGGAATKTGTVTLVGNSSADTVIGQVTADVDGLKDDASGTISGTANLLLEIPADVTKLLMREVYKESTTATYASWASARGWQNGEGYKWAFLYTPLPFSEFRRQVGLQSRSELFQESGLWQLVFRVVTTTRLTLDDRNLIGAPRFGWTPRTELVTNLTVSYDLDRAGPTEGEALTLSKQSASSIQNRFGLRTGRLIRGDERQAKTLSLSFVRDQPTASALGDYWLGWWEVPRLTATATIPWEGMALDKNDVLIADVPTVLGAMGGRRLALLIREKRYRLDDRLIDLEAIEVGFANELALSSALPLTAVEQTFVAATLALAESFSLVPGEVGSIVALVVGSEAPAGVMVETAGLLVRLAQADTLTAGLSEAAAPFVTLVPLVAPALTVTEQVFLLANLAVSEPLMLTSSEVGTATTLFLGTDSVGLVASEAAIPFIVVVSTDVLSVILAEAAAIVAALAAAETVNVALAEVADRATAARVGGAGSVVNNGAVNAFALNG